MSSFRKKKQKTGNLHSFYIYKNAHDHLFPVLWNVCFLSWHLFLLNSHFVCSKVTWTNLNFPFSKLGRSFWIHINLNLMLAFSFCLLIYLRFAFSTQSISWPSLKCLSLWNIERDLQSQLISLLIDLPLCTMLQIFLLVEHFLSHLLTNIIIFCFISIWGRWNSVQFSF